MVLSPLTRSKKDALLKIPKINHKGKYLIVSDKVTHLSNSKSAKGARKREEYLANNSNNNSNNNSDEQHVNKKQLGGPEKPKDIRDQIMPLGICRTKTN